MGALRSIGPNTFQTPCADLRKPPRPPVAQAVAQREDANVGLTVPWREHPASVGKRRGLVLDRPRIHLFVHGLIKDVCVPLGPFHVHRWVKEEHIRFDRTALRRRPPWGQELSFLNGWHAQWTKLS